MYFRTILLTILLMNTTVVCAQENETTKGKENLEKVIKIALDRKNPGQIIAINSIGVLGKKAASAVPSLATLLQSSNNNNKVIIAATETLGEIGVSNEKVVWLLTNNLESNDRQVAYQSAKTLEKIGEKYLHDIYMTLSYSEDNYARSLAADVLGIIAYNTKSKDVRKDIVFNLKVEFKYGITDTRENRIVYISLRDAIKLTKNFCQ